MTARWAVRMRHYRRNRRSYELEVTVPASWAPEDVKKYENDRSYLGEYVVVEKLYWCIAAKIRNKVTKSVIPVWEIPADQFQS